jgi:hypothetical protein
LTLVEIGGFVFTKRQPLQHHQLSNLDSSKRGNNSEISKNVSASKEEICVSSSTGEQYATMDEMMNEHENPASTPTSSRTKRRSSLGLRGKRAVNGDYRKSIFYSMILF